MSLEVVHSLGPYEWTPRPSASRSGGPPRAVDPRATSSSSSSDLASGRPVPQAHCPWSHLLMLNSANPSPWPTSSARTPLETLCFSLEVHVNETKNREWVRDLKESREQRTKIEEEGRTYLVKPRDPSPWTKRCLTKSSSSTFVFASITPQK